MILKKITPAATLQFGSGWDWLALADSGKLFVINTVIQDNFMMDNSEKKGTPIIGRDVWEHAYYLDYQNIKPDYANGFYDHINWNQVSKNYDNAIK